MSAENQLKDYARIQEELRDAILLQQVILPQEELLVGLQATHQLDCVQYYHPSSELGGDYLAVRPLEDGRVLLLTADVSGHGITAALVCFVLHSILQELLGQGFSPGEMLAKMNRRLYQILPMNKFVTMFLAVVDKKSEKLDYAAAGSPPPLLLQKGEARFIDSKGYFLGVNLEAEYPTHSLPFHAGDMLVCYSDALLETPNSKGEFFTETQLQQQVQDAGKGNASQLMKNLVNHLFTNHSHNPKDDLSLLICRAL